MKHWMTHYDSDDGAPYGMLCDCGLGDDHNAREYKEYLSQQTDKDADWGEDEQE